MARGEDLYHLDAGALAGLDADLVVTQDLCAVCAVDVSVVDDALAHLGCTAEVLTIDPHTLDEVFDSILTLGRATGHARRGDRAGRRRCGPGWTPYAPGSPGRPRPRVMLLEWTDPPFAPGHWVPEMIEAAGGEPLLGTAGAKSERVTWEAVHAAGPDVVVAAPCGFDLAGCDQRSADELVGERRAAAPAYPCTPSTPTPPGRGPAPGWSTASRSWPPSCIPPDRVPDSGPAGSGRGGVEWSIRAALVRAGPESSHQHAVSFYDHDHELVDVLARYVGDGLAVGERVVVVATAAHRLALDDALAALGLDTALARRTGYYLALDAAAMLETFMRDDVPDADLFVRHVGTIVTHASRRRDAGARLRRDGRAAVGRAQRVRRDAARGALERLRRAGRLLAAVRLPDRRPGNGARLSDVRHLRGALVAGAAVELRRPRAATA